MSLPLLALQLDGERKRHGLASISAGRGGGKEERSIIVVLKDPLPIVGSEVAKEVAREVDYAETVMPSMRPIDLILPIPYNPEQRVVSGTVALVDGELCVSSTRQETFLQCIIAWTRAEHLVSSIQEAYENNFMAACCRERQSHCCTRKESQAKLYLEGIKSLTDELTKLAAFKEEGVDFVFGIPDDTSNDKKMPDLDVLEYRLPPPLSICISTFIPWKTVVICARMNAEAKAEITTTSEYDQEVFADAARQVNHQSKQLTRAIKMHLLKKITNTASLLTRAEQRAEAFTTSLINELKIMSEH